MIGPISSGKATSVVATLDHGETDTALPTATPDPRDTVPPAAEVGALRVPPPVDHAPVDHAPIDHADEAAAEAASAGDDSGKDPPAPGFDLRSPELYLNRELTWLQFNYRVLSEARDRRTPLLERVKFLAIASSNMDEFFMKRIGGLKQQIGAGVGKLTVDGRTPYQQLEECRAVTAEFRLQQCAAYVDLLADLRRHEIRIRSFAKLAKADRQQIREHY